MIDGKMTVEEIAEYCQVGRETVRRWLQEKKITGGQKIGNTWIVPKEAIDEWMQKRKQEA